MELCGRLGDEADQAAWWAGISMTSMPFWNLIPWTTFGNWFSPFNRRHVFAAALTSLNTMSLAVFADRAPFVLMAYCSFREVLAGLDTRLDTPPSIDSHHPDSGLARASRRSAPVRPMGATNKLKLP